MSFMKIKIKSSRFADTFGKSILALACLAFVNCHADPFDWTGGVSTDWGTAGNWFQGTTPVNTDYELFGVNQPVTSGTIDLGGIIATNFSTTPTTTSSGGATTNALTFGNLGGVTSYTIQNGNIQSTGEGLLRINTNITVNFNASTTGLSKGRMFQLANGSTLNIGDGNVQANRVCIYGDTNAIATVNVNAINYSPTNIWLVGAGSSGVTHSNSTDADLTLNLNATQIIVGTSPGANCDLNVGWTTGAHEHKVVVKNNAIVSLAGRLILGGRGQASAAPGPFSGNGRLVIGDATSTGTFTNTGATFVRLGGSTSGTGTGTVDIVNGTWVLLQAEANLLAYGGVPGSRGVINIYTNGLVDTRGSFARKSGSDAGSAVINFDGGTIQPNSGSVPAQRTNLFDSTLTVNIKNGGMVFNCNGKADSAINASLLNSGVGGLTVRDLSGSSVGKLTLKAANTYVGTTWIRDYATLALGTSASIANSQGILIQPNAKFDVTLSSGFTVGAGKWISGSGVVNGSVIVAGGGSVVPGVNVPGTLTFSNDLTLQSGASATFRLNTTNSPATNDSIVVNGTLSFTSSAIIVTNAGPSLNVGDSFTLLNQPTSGFTTVNLPTGYTWTNRLAIDGSIAVLSVVSATPSPTNISFSVTGNNLVLNWPANQGWSLQAQTNSLGAGLTTNWVTVPGATPPFTNSLNPANPSVFYRLKY